MLYSNSKSTSFEDVILNTADTPKPIKPGCFPPFFTWFMEWLGLRTQHDNAYDSMEGEQGSPLPPPFG